MPHKTLAKGKPASRTSQKFWVEIQTQGEDQNTEWLLNKLKGEGLTVLSYSDSLDNGDDPQ